MPRNILILDPTCPKPYTPNDLHQSALGGTEATVVRVAQALSAFANITVCQTRHAFNAIQDGASYVGSNFDISAQQWDSIITLRSFNTLDFLRKIAPHTKKFIWLHDNPQNRFSEQLKQQKIYDDFTLVCVSQNHQQAVINKLKTHQLTLIPPVTYCYNPVVTPNFNKTINRNKLIFTSSPHKGLTQTLKIFAKARQLNPDFELYIANPGYYQDHDVTQEKNIHVIGQVPQRVALQHVAESLCLFYPNHVYAETFGLVMAEANSVGTPVIAHHFGAAPEILSAYPEQIVDCTNDEAVLNRLMSWYEKRPLVHLDQRFSLSQVTKQWRSLLDI